MPCQTAGHFLSCPVPSQWPRLDGVPTTYLTRSSKLVLQKSRTCSAVLPADTSSLYLPRDCA